MIIYRIAELVAILAHQPAKWLFGQIAFQQGIEIAAVQAGFHHGEGFGGQSALSVGYPLGNAPRSL